MGLFHGAFFGVLVEMTSLEDPIEFFEKVTKGSVEVTF